MEIADLGSADDHVNLKSDSAGRVYAVVKTSEKGPSDTLISLLVRDPDSATWSGHTVGTVFDDFTRAICVVDEEQGIVFVVTTRPVAEAHEGAVQMKMAPLDSIYFKPGLGIPVIRDIRAPDMSDATSTKQPVTSRTGLVVLASNNLTRRYWHSFTPLETSPLVRIRAIRRRPSKQALSRPKDLVRRRFGECLGLRLRRSSLSSVSRSGFSRSPRFARIGASLSSGRMVCHTHVAAAAGISIGLAALVL